MPPALFSSTSRAAPARPASHAAIESEVNRKERSRRTARSTSAEASRTGSLPAAAARRAAAIERTARAPGASDAIITPY